jgi:hypothetical protein
MLLVIKQGDKDMLACYKKVLLIITFFTIKSGEQKKKEFSYTIKKQFQNMVKAIHFDNETIKISSSFSLDPRPCVVIFVPTDKVRDPQSYAHSVHNFLEHFSLPTINGQSVGSNQRAFFLMNQITDGKSSTKRNMGEILGEFIEWIYSYNRNCTIILVSDRNGSSVINYASHGPQKKTSPTVHTIIQLYPTIPHAISNQSEQALYMPNTKYYKDLFIIYSDHINTFTNKKGQKFYPPTISHISCLPLHNNEQIAPEEFLSTLCAERLWQSLQKAKVLYPQHKNMVLYWSQDHKDLDLSCFLKDKELVYSPVPLSKRPFIGISQERVTSTHIRSQVETSLSMPLKITLPLSEQSRYFYDTMATK